MNILQTHQFLRSLALLLVVLIGSCVSQDKEREATLNAVELGHQYARDGLLREATQSYKKALSKDPDQPAANRNIGLIYVKTGEYKKAINHLQKSLGKYRDNFETNFYLAQALRAEERFGDAIYYYKIALNLNPGDIKTLKALAWSNYKIRYYQEALKVANDLQKIANDDAQTYIIMARILIKLQNYKKALSIIQNAQAFAKKSEQPYLISVEGEVYLAMSRYEDAQKSFRLALKDQPLLAGSLLGLGRALIETGTRVDQAIGYIERAVRLKPQLKEAYFYLGKWYEQSDPSKAVKYYKTFHKQAHSDPEFSEQLLAVSQILETLEKKGSKKKSTPSDSNKEEL